MVNKMHNETISPFVEKHNRNEMRGGYMYVCVYMYVYIKKKVGNTTTSHILIFPRALSVKQHLQEVCKQYGDVVKGNNVTSLCVLMSGTFCVKCRF